MAIAEDWDAFFSPADFAEPFTLTVGTSVTSGYGIFDANYVDFLTAEAWGPVLTVPSVGYPNVAQGQTVTINGTTYTIVEVMGPPDAVDRGELRLRLRS